MQICSSYQALSLWNVIKQQTIGIPFSTDLNSNIKIELERRTLARKLNLQVVGLPIIKTQA